MRLCDYNTSKLKKYDFFVLCLHHLLCFESSSSNKVIIRSGRRYCKTDGTLETFYITNLNGKERKKNERVKQKKNMKQWDEESESAYCSYPLINGTFSKLSRSTFFFYTLRLFQLILKMFITQRGKKSKHWEQETCVAIGIVESIKYIFFFLHTHKYRGQIENFLFMSKNYLFNQYLSVFFFFFFGKVLKERW